MIFVATFATFAIIGFQETEKSMADLGEWVQTRRYSGKSTFVMACAIYAMIICIALFVVYNNRPEGNVRPPSVMMPVAIILGIGLAMPVWLTTRAWKIHGAVLDLFENGIRWKSPRAGNWEMAFSEAIRVERVLYKGMLARIEFTVKDGTKRIVAVHSPEDVQIIQEMLVRAGAFETSRVRTPGSP